jgi:diadenosine tetraphosphate (Ap4A) HIT family hydrolase
MPAERIQETCALAFVVEDAFPVSPGHTLVIPRRHVSSFFDLTDAEISALWVMLRAAKERLDPSLRPTGYNVGINVGMASGQTIMHVHVHLIPRFLGDTHDPTGGVRNVIPGKGPYEGGGGRRTEDE